MSKLDFISDRSGDIDLFMERHAAFRSLTRSELEALPERDILPAVTSWIEGKFAEDWSDMCRVVNNLPTPCLNVYCADYTAKEILSGGFAQAFFNSSRDFIGAAAEGFRAMGYAAPAEVIEQALKAHFDSGGNISGRGLEDFLAYSENSAFTELDERFCAAFDREEFGRLVYDYVMSYKKYFGEQD